MFKIGGKSLTIAKQNHSWLESCEMYVIECKGGLKKEIYFGEFAHASWRQKGEKIKAVNLKMEMEAKIINILVLDLKKMSNFECIT